MKKSKVMIVDDCDLTLNMTRDFLEEEGFEVIIRAESIGAINDVLSKKPDCVLMDVSMPLIEGPDLVRAIKDTSNIKIILYSAKEEKELRKLSEDCGADAYIKKGGDHSRLLKQLISTIES